MAAELIEHTKLGGLTLAEVKCSGALIMLVDILAYLLIGCFGIILLAALSTAGRCLAIWIFRAKISFLGPWEIVIGWFSLVLAFAVLPVCFLISGSASAGRGSGVVYFSRDPFAFGLRVLVVSTLAVVLVVVTVKIFRWFRQKTKPPEF